MSEIPDSLVHWMLGGLVPLGGGLFIFLLKRTFKEFEDKLASLFGQLEGAIRQTQAHDTKIQLIEHRLTAIESKRKR